MRFKTALVTGFLILFMIVVVGVAALNGGVLKAPFNLLGIPMRVGTAMLLALMAGFIGVGMWLAVSGLANALQRWVSDLKRHGERLAESAYLKGLDASLGSRPIEAINHFQRALDADPSYLPALLKLGDAYRGSGRLKEALACHRQALEQHPRDVQALYALTEDNLVQGDHEEAKRHLHDILRIQPRRALKALRLLRDLYIRETNWVKALEVQERIGEARVLEEERAADAPYVPGLLYQIGVDLLGQDKFAAAIAHLEKLRAKHPGFQATYIKLAEAYLLDGRESEAVRVYLDGYRATASPMCLLAMEQLYLEKGDPEGAAGQYVKLIDSMDRKVLPKFLLGRFFYRLEMLDKAEALFREIEGSIRQSGLLQYYLGRIRERRADPAGACGRYREVIRILNPFELNYRCTWCGDFSPDWQDFCDRCQRWDTFAPTFKDDLMQEIQEPSPVFYQGTPWKSSEA